MSPIPYYSQNKDVMFNSNKLSIVASGLMLLLVGCGGGSISGIDVPGTGTEIDTDTGDEIVTEAEFVNAAFNKIATQSSSGSGGASGGVAGRAVDGNTDGIYVNESVSHTGEEAQPWWQVDLGVVENISTINIFNRTDNCCTQRLSDFYLLVSDESFSSDDLQASLDQTGMSSFYFGPTVDGSTTFDVNAEGRYVRVQLAGDLSILSLAEVEVMVGGDVDPVDPVVTPTPVAGETIDVATTPLSRLSNKEFVNSVRYLLELSDDSPSVDAALTTLAAENNVSGLTNDSEAQSYSTAFASGYVDVASAAADDFLSGLNDLADLEEKLDCDALEAASNVNNYTSLICFRDFSRQLIEQAYGRPFVDADEPSEYFQNIESYVTQAGLDSDSLEAYQFRLRAMLPYIFLSPEFLLFVENGEADLPDGVEGRYLNDYEIAKRLAYFLTGTPPDESLMTAAESDLLSDPEVRVQHAERLLEETAVADQFAEFFLGWLGVTLNDQVEQSDIDLLKSFLNDWFANEQPFSDLYTGSVEVSNSDGTTTARNLGAIGTKAFVGSNTNDPVPSFINRGQFVTTQLLCANLPEDPPIEAFAESSVAAENAVDLFHELKTHACATCHQVFDSYGALFQQFEQETSLYNPNLIPLGDSFVLTSIGDISGEFDGLESFSQSLGDSESAAQCASELLYRHSVRRAVDLNGEDDLALQVMFDEWSSSGDTSIKSLLKVIVGSDQFISIYE